jgi:hypothetical protein
MKRFIRAFIFLGFKRKKGGRNKKIEIGKLVIKESRGHRVKRKKESAIKELLKISNFILGKLLKS